MILRDTSKKPLRAIWGAMAQGGHPLMWFPAGATLFFTLIALITAVATAAPNQFVTRYLPIGISGSASLLAVDASGNFFIVATVEESSGQQQIRAIKTDSQGNELASFDFGSGSDILAGAAVDPQGNLVIVGTTYAKSNSQAAFIVKLDSQVTKILSSTVLGGSQGFSSANAVALDTDGNIYVTGNTASADFPVTQGAFQTAGPMSNGAGSPTYAFVTEISPNGMSTVFSTFFGSASTNCNGGSICIGAVGATSANAIALDNTGAVVIGGYTTTNQLPVTPGTLGQQCNAAIDPSFRPDSWPNLRPGEGSSIGRRTCHWHNPVPNQHPGTSYQLRLLLWTRRGT
jgi:Beta-propeller repeat